MTDTTRGRGTGLFAGAAAAVLWWGVNALSVHLTYNDTVPAAFAQLVLPAAVPSFTWVTPQPWPVLAPALSAVAVGALTAWFTRLAGRAATAGRGLVVFASWFGVVAAAVIVGVAIGLGVTIADWPPGRLYNALDAFPGPVQQAAVWGAVWGWIPALLARVGRRPSARLLPAVVLGVIFTGLAVAGQASAQLPSPTGQASPAPTPTAPATPIPTAAPGAPAADPDWCSATQVELSLSPEDGAAGHRAMTLTATNRTGVDCMLNGYPDLAFGDAASSLLVVHAVRGGSFAADDPGPTEVRLGAGQSAKSILGWDAQPSDPAHQVHWVAAALYPGATRTLLPAQVDLIAGADLGYTAWQAAAG
ncbi:DUF4232 domain-containing protein [Gryllotalpicola protaetiae]|uniref:DUF4232 domain-containing protein n=1 Tax=Gryllotalpicola protaetiae TaxID=2419771 RepID=A0A387BG75_9MICO|nr:DUF4232 domain-containing protein [Gryllotalpicola protaetiae]AYG02933.1 DUF4232 domain-containing protein [Gryllotalpicola protaetiae]